MIGSELAKKIFGDISGKKVMLVGAGEMAELAAEHLVTQGISEVIVANRTLENAVLMAKRFKGTPVGLNELLDQLEKGLDSVKQTVFSFCTYSQNSVIRS